MGEKARMKAIVQDRYGPPSALELRDIDRPVPAAGEVLVRVRAAAVNALDWHFVRGDPYAARLSLGLRRPTVPVRGRDFAGVVEAVGPGVTTFGPGDEVYGEANGSFAEFAIAPLAAIDRKPANLSFEQAAAIPLAGITALMGIRDAAQVHKGQTILINGASGGVGPYAIQLAKQFGAEVTAVCRTRNVELVRSVGADHVVDYTREDFTRGGRRYDAVFDLVGNRSMSECRRVLRPGGVLVLSGGGVYRGGSLLGPIGLIIKATLTRRFVRDRVVVLTARPSSAHLATLRELAEAGRLTPVIDRTYPLADVAAAISYLEGEHARAKVVITVP
jgi:NADPH:quinone reductase-like Zn-dependent oxidoreductase